MYVSLKNIFLKNNRYFITALIFGAGCNLLILASPLFTLQVYDRVLTSTSLPTLFALAAITTLALLAYMLTDIARSLVLSRASVRLDNLLSQKLALSSITVKQPSSAPGSVRLMRDLDSLRSFIAGPGVIAITDIPWIPFFILVISWIHPYLGLLAAMSCLFLILLSFLSEKMTARWVEKSSQKILGNYRDISRIENQAETVISLGMKEKLIDNWHQTRQEAVSTQLTGISRNMVFVGISKASRLLVQTFMIALGAFLVLAGDITPGGMIAASIIAGRTLAPVDQGIAAWKQWRPVKSAFNHIDAALKTASDHTDNKTNLPPLTGNIRLEQVTCYPDKDRKPALIKTSFTLKPGSAIGIIGKNGSGKTTLCRLLTRHWEATAGRVLLDGTDISNWPAEQLTSSIGYSPQAVEFPEGSIKNNIARFENDADKEIVDAAKLAGIHETIMGLPQGYETIIYNNSELCPGLLKQVSIARAIFRRPKIIILDEPDSTLDKDSKASLIRLLHLLKKQGHTLLVTTHDRQVMAALNLLMVMQDRSMLMYGSVAGVCQELSRQEQKQPGIGVELPFQSVAETT